MLSGGFRFALPTLQSAMTKEKRKRNADRRVQPTSAPYGRGARPCLFSLSRLRGEGREGARSPIGVPPRLLAVGRSNATGRSFRHALPATWSGRTIPKLRTTGFERPCASQRALPAPSCPSPASSSQTGHNAGRRVPEAARVRSVSFRARAPHSLHLSEYLRDRRPWLSEIRCTLYLKWGPMSITLSLYQRFDFFHLAFDPFAI